jgi:hypothetical protein
MKLLHRSTLLLCSLILFLTVNISAQTFGRYADCTTGRGICGIGIENIDEGIEWFPGDRKFIISRLTDSTLQLRLVKANITVADEPHIFGAALASLPADEPLRIYIDDAVPISSMVRKLLVIPDAFKMVAAGIFTVTETDTYLITELKLL